MSSISTVRGGPRGIVTDGLVLWLDASYPQSYPGFGTGWYDLTSNRNNGTLTNGPTYSSANGGSIQFDGVDDYVDCGNQSSINLISSITVSAWIKSAYTANIYRGIVDKGRDDFGAWSLNVDETFGGGQNQSTFKIKISGVNRYVRSVSKYSNNAWTQIVGTFDGTFLSIYQNEKLENSLNYPGTIGVNSISVKIGSTNDGYALNGNIGVVSIYNRALSATEVLQNYNATKTRFGL